MFGFGKKAQSQTETKIKIHSMSVADAREWWKTIFTNTLYVLVDEGETRQEALSHVPVAAEVADRALEAMEQRWGKPE